MDRGAWWATVHGVIKSWTVFTHKDCTCNILHSTTKSQCSQINKHFLNVCTWKGPMGLWLGSQGPCKVGHIKTNTHTHIQFI